MKRIAFVLVLILLSGSLSAQMDLATFALGKWLDPNYDAVWSVTTGNIKILDTNGNLYYDFDGKTIQNFSVKATTEGLTVTFYCVETKKTYSLIQPLTGRDITLRIKRDGLPDYEVKMPFQGN